ncbi:hypothetical protein L2E82_32051 [Cichorium intybus]|uniref:Uncharacterized protein n=1 Tax=Cichorium intybus TaxID=13427 RepID=A0ACB9BG51_CICIN|nr:hypothetical protein L2E82_32051 [Cichorium intybus]
MTLPNHASKLRLRQKRPSPSDSTTKHESAIDSASKYVSDYNYQIRDKYKSRFQMLKMEENKQILKFMACKGFQLMSWQVIMEMKKSTFLHTRGRSNKNSSLINITT